MTNYPSAVLAVDRALSAAAREMILAALKNTSMDGAQVADYVDYLCDHDEYLAVTEPWHQAHGVVVLRLLLAERPDLPVAYAGELLSASLMTLVVLIPTEGGVLPPSGQDVYRLAVKAACWAEGYEFVAALTRPVIA